MGTRADFYVGIGKSAEWLGSIAFDGCPEGIADYLFIAPTERAFRAKVAGFIASKNHGTTPDMGWPWPWEDSRTTDYAYAWTGDGVRAWCFGHAVPEDVLKARRAADYDYAPDGDDWHDAPQDEFPDMSERTNVALGDRSGTRTLIIR